MTNQMDLSFDKPTAFLPRIRHQRRLRQAGWWFAQMRQVVDRALDRSQTPSGPPEQVYFSWTGRPEAN
jgi:hypothetical protein